MLLLFSAPLCGYAQEVETPNASPFGFPWDWSHQHLVFTNSTDLTVVERLRQDPRLFHHWLRRNSLLFQHRVSDGVRDAVSSPAYFLAGREHPTSELQSGEFPPSPR